MDREYRSRTHSQRVDLNRQLITAKLKPDEDPMNLLDRMTRTGDDSKRLGTTARPCFVLSIFVRQVLKKYSFV